MIININEVHVNSISHSAAAATQVECTINLFIYLFIIVGRWSTSLLEGKNRAMRKYKEYLGVRERLSHWQSQTPDIWNKLVLDTEVAVSRHKWFPLDPWQAPALDNTSPGWFNSQHPLTSSKWFILQDLCTVQTTSLARKDGAVLAEGAVAEPMDWQMQLQTSSSHSVLGCCGERTWPLAHL